MLCKRDTSRRGRASSPALSVASLVLAAVVLCLLLLLLCYHCRACMLAHTPTTTRVPAITTIHHTTVHTSLLCVSVRFAVTMLCHTVTHTLTSFDIFWGF